MSRYLYGIMVKYPLPGNVKTRLAKDIGDEKAAEVYRQLAEKVMKNTRPSFFGSPFNERPPLANSHISSFSKRGISNIPVSAQYCETKYERIIFYDPPERLTDFDTWLPGEHFLVQRGSDVGERMANAVRDLLNMGAEKAVITGADIPDLTAAIIAEAFAALDHADIVIGPAKDGGYYLIGMKSPHPEIFQNISWSTVSVYQETIAVLNRFGLIYRTVTTLSDLDTREDYDRAFEKKNS